MRATLQVKNVFTICVCSDYTPCKLIAWGVYKYWTFQSDL